MTTLSEVAAGVFCIPLAWGNAYLLAHDGEAALIDTGLAQDRSRLTAALGELGIAADSLRKVLLTHAHCDHAGSAAFFSGRSKTPSAYRARLHVHHEEVMYLAPPRRRYPPAGREILARPQCALAFAIGEWMYPVERVVPDETVQDDDRIAAPGGELIAIFTPGHTPGHVSYYRPDDGVLFSGDAILNIIPIKREITLSLPMALFTYDMLQAKRSAKRLTLLKPEILLPGHGPPVREDTAQRLIQWINPLLEAKREST